MHEGVGASEEDAGASGRWLRRRSVAAVTGAFMALRRDIWERLGGLAERDLPVAFNDVDICMTIRSLGLRVVYEPGLLLIHHESKTRGMNVTRSQVAWDRVELRALHRRWGDAIFVDDTLNPHWSRHGQPFDAYREPSMTEVLAYLTEQKEPRRPPFASVGDEAATSDDRAA